MLIQALGDFRVSHVVQIQTQVRDPATIAAACRRRQLPPPINGTHQLFTSTVSGWGVQLPDWRFPVVCQTENGHLHFDDYGGRWGDRQHLDKFLQAYAVERATLEARRQGHTVLEQPLPDGSIKLTVSIGGAL